MADDAVSVAYHEAGHAVAAWYTGNSVGQLTIEPDDDQGIAGRTCHGDSDAESGDLGLRFWSHPAHQVVVEEPDGEFRLTTPAEREHLALLDEVVELDYRDRYCLVCAAGEAAHRRLVEFDVSYSPPPGDWGSSLDRSDARECDPNVDWARTVRQAQEFLARPPVWRCVEALARALLNSRTLSGLEVKRILVECVVGDGHHACHSDGTSD